MKKTLAIILCFAMLLSAMAFAGCSKKEKPAAGETDTAPAITETIKIGLIIPRTGQVAQYGIAVENAVNLAVEKLNAAGGISGQKVELVTYDNKADVAETISIYNRLVDQDKVSAIIGPVISSTTLAVTELAQEDGIPMITPTDTNKEVTIGKDFVFRACYTDPYQGGTVATFAKDSLKATKAAVLYNSGDDYSTGLADAFKAKFEENGGTITDFEGYTADDKDFKAVLNKIKGSSPEVLFIPDYYNTVGLIAGQVKTVGLDVTMVGGDGWDDVQKKYAEVAEGSYFANHYATDDTDPIVQNFVTAYQEKFNETPNALGALGYDAANILLEAIKKANSVDGKAIQAALQATDLDAVAGHVTFDENGDPLKTISIIKVEGGKLKLETKVGGK